MYNILRLSLIVVIAVALSCSGKVGTVPVTREMPAMMIEAIQEDYPFSPGYYFHDELPEQTAFLTFDDGPGDWTSSILDTLARENVKATFFVCARWNMKGKSGTLFQKYPDVLKRMKHEGHVIANHTATHRTLTWMGEDSIKFEILFNQRMLDEALGDDSVRMTVFRPPMGRPWFSNVPLKEKVRVVDIISGYAVTMLWSIDSSDSWDWAEGEWYRNSSRVDSGTESFRLKKTRIYNRVLKGADGRGAVVLFHDTHNTTAEVLPEIIAGLKAKGYVFGTAEDLLLWKYGVSSSELVFYMNYSP